MMRLGRVELVPDGGRRVARIAFLAALEQVAPEVIKELEDGVLPVYLEAFPQRAPRSWGEAQRTRWLAWRNSGAQGRSFYATLGREAPASSPGKANPRTLEEKAREFRNAIEAWSRRYHLAEDWIFDAVVLILNSWRHPHLRGRFAVLSLGDKAMELPYTRDLEPPVWEPWMETEEEYLVSVQAYVEAVRARYREHRKANWEAAPAKRARSGSPFLHFEWLVRYQVQEWSTEQIAEHYADGGNLDRRSVEAAVKQTARLIGLSLRPPKRGRPAKTAR